jgi:4'-phosphopantetheinyl transferase
MELNESQVHFWFTPLTEADPRIRELGHLLSSVEIRRAERFHLERDRSSFIISHGVLRQLLGRYLGLKPEDIEYQTGPHGKPSLSPVCGGSSLQFNMSHTYGMAVFALTRSGRIGVDVERMDRNITDRDEIAAGFFSPMEAAVYRALPGEDRVEGFFNCWTRKESFIKAIGDGLTCPLDSFQVTLRPGDQAQLLSVRNGRAEDWSMVSLEPLNGYKSAITAEATWQLADLGEFNDAATCQRG